MLLLIDASVPVQNIDLGCAEWLHEHEVPFSLVFTKIDKRKKRVPSPPENIANFEVKKPSLISCRTTVIGEGQLAVGFHPILLVSPILNCMALRSNMS